MNDQPLRVTERSGVARVRIDHPPTNLVDGPLIMALVGLLDRLEAGASTRVIVFSSDDPDFFLMHGDVRGILEAPARPYQPATAPNFAAAAFQRLSMSKIVSIGIIDGAARGGGVEFLTALDLRVGSPRTVFGQPEVAMGILPGAGGTSRLPRLLGRSRALDIILTGRDVCAEEALAIGWLDALVPSAELEGHADRLARRIAVMPSGSVAAVKRVVDFSLGDITPALVAETDAYAQLTSRQQHLEPMHRFLARGGQTREGERDRFDEIVDAMLDD